ncbi:MAG: glycosyltransferase [Desulfovibrio sp.]|nr:glycosyltransferase [Desulfovibrio sp.]
MSSICFCNGNAAWGGGEAWHLNAARSLAKRGLRTLLLCRPGSALYKRARLEKSMEVYPFAPGRLSFLNPLYLLRLTRFLRKQEVGALIMNLSSDLKAAGPAALRAGVKHVVYRRGSDLPVRDSLFNRLLYGRVITRLIVNSQATLRSVLARNPGLVDAGRVSVLPNGIDCAAFDAALAEALAARVSPCADRQPRQRAVDSDQSRGQVSLRVDGVHMNYPDDERRGQASPCAGGEPRPEPEVFVIGNAGRLDRQKGQQFLLYLARSLKNAAFPFRLIIAGAGRREAGLKALAGELGVDNEVRFAGFMENLAPFWAEIDLFMLSSLWEGFGSVVLEAGLAQKPVFAFRVSNLPELIFEGENGRLFPLPANGADAACADIAGASDAVARAIIKAAGDPEELRRMGRRGRELALGYSQEACMEALLRLMPEMCATRGNTAADPCM